MVLGKPDHSGRRSHNCHSKKGRGIFSQIIGGLNTILAGNCFVNNKATAS